VTVIGEQFPYPYFEPGVFSPVPPIFSPALLGVGGEQAAVRELGCKLGQLLRPLPQPTMG